MCADLFRMAPHKKECSHWLIGGPARGEESQECPSRGAGKGGGSSGVGWPSIPCCTRGSRPELVRYSMQGSGQVLLCVFNIPRPPRCARALGGGAITREQWRGAGALVLPSALPSTWHPGARDSPTRLSLLLMNSQAFSHNWVRQPCDLLTAHFLFEKMFVYFKDHFEGSPWTCSTALGGWVIFHLFSEVGCFVVVFAVSRYRRLGVSSCLHFIGACLTPGP